MPEPETHVLDRMHHQITSHVESDDGMGTRWCVAVDAMKAGWIFHTEQGTYLTMPWGSKTLSLTQHSDPHEATLNLVRTYLQKPR